MSMQGITLVTGNPSKLKEWQAIMPQLALTAQKVSIDEIQSLSIGEIAQKKARAAFAVLGKPVIVEDVGFFLDRWGGLPGPFIKYFEEFSPSDSLIHLLGSSENRRGYAHACIAYCNGEDEFVVSGKVHGTVTDAVRGPEGAFGFDYCFVPDGHEETFAEMGDDRKNALSHRRRAIEAFVQEYTKRSGVSG